ncbi:MULTISPECIES: bifunctional demethylmenaquinone methyltransferase/2-methoxy-6-polyprenyl-1,4-benzoquinol methylase UbiE [Lactobacillus]|uniref:Demethylmenaquinone methyltransferase n=1 Tax=Lactobacillus xujianguonis TaxID=2495899 RepID=A0A437SVG4_9LACO|nr:MULTISPECIES: bifunctional demethylmenaquinone methyltransferase/2-methoxy-6-polyprenyl-1,4-benzoquinol methylase UbiE [Lactobacillus]RVU70913.1 bifunctional demethylmenaquinone methyltransferase/2-methoxy-6-polyprenyl-1,4-benzoquinol methylase UbiE [Lactobacillus xujianguonis]RVU73741.1 bifunctional demethylmenaquinone methyltransferase/2-methoxy-6-polyprenyl-1,4-benzoquinol methylase UbiE [Lactobacillus xujianguonis]
MSLTNKFSEEEVNALFSRVAPKYDVMNNFVSLGVQNIWRQRFIHQLKLTPQSTCLDLCCGTADSTIALAKRVKLAVGLDFNADMLKLAQKKIKQKNLQPKIRLVQGDAMKPPFAPNTFDCITICFGLRNVPDAGKTLQAAYRLLKPGGQMAILEMSQPTQPLIKKAWRGYFKLFPYFAKLTKAHVGDYQYLSKTSQAFLTAEQLKKLLESSGFTQVKVTPLTLGVGAIHIGLKPLDAPSK